MSATTLPETVIVPSRLLGSLAIPQADLFDVPAGLYGFETSRTFALVPAGRDGLWWLQSAERAELVFLLADPFTFFPGHVVDIPPGELAHIDATDASELMALVIVTLPTRSGDAPTANLRAPVVIDPARHVARQVVLGDETLSMTAAVNL
jgi:flagellar assembly factor FliW